MEDGEKRLDEILGMMSRRAAASDPLHSQKADLPQPPCQTCAPESLPDEADDDSIVPELTPIVVLL